MQTEPDQIGHGSGSHQGRRVPIVRYHRCRNGDGRDERDPEQRVLHGEHVPAQGIVDVARRAGAGTVALSGGCFQNVLLLDLTVAALRDAGLNVLTHHELPPNDGNIAAGQALGALLNLTTVTLPN